MGLLTVSCGFVIKLVRLLLLWVTETGVRLLCLDDDMMVLSDVCPVVECLEGVLYVVFGLI